MRLHLPLYFAVILSLLPCPRAGAAPPATSRTTQPYISLLRQQIASSSRPQLAAISRSAEAAAARITSGGTLWVTSSQKEFPNEAVQRAGGLMLIRTLSTDNQAGAHDVILFGAASEEMPPSELARLRDTGAMVVTFGRPGTADITSGEAPGIILPDGRLCPTDTVLNLVNLWTWTAEFTAACTRHGQMPVLYKSYGLPGGRERARKYADKPFHDYFTIPPIPAQQLGGRYLDTLDHILSSIEHDEADHIAVAASCLRAAERDRAFVLAEGHIFPQHLLDPRTPQPFHVTAWPSNWPDRAQTLLLIGYQFPPQDLITALQHDPDRRLICCTVQPPAFNAANVLSIAPHWPLDDGCITIPGYDIPILPASAIAQTAIYWSIVQQTAAPAPQSP